MPTHTSREGTTNADVSRTPQPVIKDESDAVHISVTSKGSRIWKQTPGMNNSIVPLVPEPTNR